MSWYEFIVVTYCCLTVSFQWKWFQISTRLPVSNSAWSAVAAGRLSPISQTLLPHTCSPLMCKHINAPSSLAAGQAGSCCQANSTNRARGTYNCKQWARAGGTPSDRGTDRKQPQQGHSCAWHQDELTGTILAFSRLASLRCYWIFYFVHLKNVAIYGVSVWSGPTLVILTPIFKQHRWKHFADRVHVFSPSQVPLWLSHDSAGKY